MKITTSLPKCMLLGLIFFSSLSACDKTENDPTDPNNPNNPGAGVFQQGGGVTDIDGNQYPTVIINGQEWMALNLRTTRYANGDSIVLVTDNSLWNSTLVGAYGSIDNDPANDLLYGKIYNGFAAAIQNAPCPQGWHVPSNSEWEALATFLGGKTVAGGKLKAEGTDYWLSPNTGATNLSGMNIRGAGVRNLAGAFSFAKETAYFWTSANYVTQSSGYYASLNYNSEALTISTGVKRLGYCLRCVKD